MIYIDPPYNTGNDFIYDDDFKQSQDDYDEGSGAVDENGDRMFKNTDSNGRFHSDWCSMIYSRLSLARNLLSNDGCIFISIDDKELQDLKRCCDEIFGEKNYIGQIVVPKGTTTGQDAHDMGSSVDYLLSYSKNKQLFQLKGLELDEKDKKRFNLVDEKGHYSTLQLRKTGKNDRREDRPNLYYGIVTPEGETVFPVGPGGYESCWRADENTYKKWLKENLIVWNQTDKGLMPYVKYYLEGRTKQVSNLWTDIEGNKKASITVRELFGSSVFDNPKPVGLIQKIITISTDNESLILDFFSGSATSAHAVMQLNAEDGGRRRFIMVQLPEKCDEKTEAYKAGYKNICEIGKERIRRAAKKIHEEHPDAKFDDGFRVLKVDESNMTDVYYSADTYDQNMLDQLESNIKADRTDLDLLFGCLLEWGLPLSMPYTSEEIEGCAIHTYNDGDLIACFNNDIPESVIKEIAKRKPLRAVFRDSGFKGSPEKINVGETFSSYLLILELKSYNSNP